MIVMVLRALFIALMMLWLTALVARADGRDPATVRAFRATHPCPSTGKTTGPCKGWVVDHKYPLCAGGHDDPSNMMWQEYESSLAKDRIERELCACRGAK